MRTTLLAFALTSLAVPAAAQTNPSQNPAPFQTMQAADAARLNQAVQNDTRARAALDQVEKRLNEAGHPAGKMLETTRP